MFLDLLPKIEARLKAEAAARNMTASQFVTLLLEQWNPRPQSASEDNGHEEETSQEIVENIVIESLRRMQKNQIRNWDLTVQVMTHKNNLVAEVEKAERVIAEYQRKAQMALESGNRELAKQFFREKTMHEALLPGLKSDLASATEAAERVKEAIKQEEERMHRRTAQAQGLEAAFRQMKIQLQIARALDQFRSTEENETRWAQLQERVRSLAAQVAEIGAEISPLVDALGVEGEKRWSEMPESIKAILERIQRETPPDSERAKSELDRELADLEQRLRADPWQQKQSDVERKLADLEQRLGAFPSKQDDATPRQEQMGEDIDAQLDILERLLEIEDDTPDKDGEE